jgi:hypothetical protein
MTARRLGVLWAMVALVSLALPATAQAWWERLEKLSGPGPFWGKVYEFRVACFGEVTPAAAASRTAELSMSAARLTNVDIPEGETLEARRIRENSQAWLRSVAGWQRSIADWQSAANAWATELGEPYSPTNPSSASASLAIEEEARAKAFERRARASLMATSSVGVFWSFCQSEKKRHIGIDVSWNTMSAEGRPDYAGGAPINLDTMMASVSWRLLADTNYDFVDVGAGGGAYWFTSTGFPEHHGVVLQPLRVTFRAPPAWSGKKFSNWRRWAALPVYGAGITMFPAGFEANAFAGVGDKAVRLPRELIFSQYIFVNVQPLLQLLRK